METGLVNNTIPTAYRQLVLSSKAFANEDWIPSIYTCDGLNVNPSISISKIPAETKSLAIIMEDPDVSGESFCHWVTWNLPVTNYIMENEGRGAQGINDFRRNHYYGPCPGKGIEHYVFRVFALDAIINMPLFAGRKELEKAMEGHIVAIGEITGKYKRVDFIGHVHRLKQQAY